MATSNGLDNARYLNLETRRRTGARIVTPIWFAPHEGQYFAYSNAQAGKVKRLRHTPEVRIAAADMRGNPLGEWFETTARLLDDEALARKAYQALKARYGWQITVANALSFLGGQLKHRQFICIERPAE